MAPRSRYLHLAWAKWELEHCNMANACKLLERGHQLNPQDGALLQVPPPPSAPPSLCRCAHHACPRTQRTSRPAMQRFLVRHV